jgi:hypothetical protein
MTFKLQPNIPLKYLLDSHTALPSYPTRQDFIFDILSYIVKVTQVKSKDFDPGDIKFSTKTLKYVFGDKLTAEFLEKLKLLMKDLIEDTTLIKKGEFIIIDQSEFLKFYIISN